MEFISSDTNVWVDFNTIDMLKTPFRLNATYIMYEEAIQREITHPVGLNEKLRALGLRGVEMTVDEFFFADQIATKCPKLSTYDRIALSIAKKRGITLLTGDNAMRKAAQQEAVYVIGSIGLLDRLYGEDMITAEEYRTCLERFFRYEGNEIRLPKAELEFRLSRLR